MRTKEEIFKPTVKTPVSNQSKNFEKNFSKTMSKDQIKLNEVDGMLSEVEQSLKKKIFSLAKMEALVFSDPKLTAVYNEMSENGEEKYGYHYNETIQNMIFNDYVLNSPKYLQKYKMAIPKEKKRRDASGINQLKKAGEETMAKTNPEFKPKEPTGLPKKPTVTELNGTNETTGAASSGAFAPALGFQKKQLNEENDQPQEDDCFVESNGFKLSVSCGGKFQGQFIEDEDAFNAIKKWKKENNWYPNTWFISDHGNMSLVDDNGNKLKETTTSASSGAYVGPAAWGSGDLMKAGGKSKAMRKPIWKGGTIIQESNYLVDPSGFQKYIQELNEADISYQNDMVEPHPENQNLPTDGVSGIDAEKSKTKPFVDINKSSERKNADNFIIDKTTAFTSDAVKGWNNNDTNLELDTINTGDPDKPNLNLMEEQTQNIRKISTPEELKAYVAEKKAQGVKGLTKEDTPMLAGQALYNVAVRMADRMLPMGWDGLADVNSMWDYIKQNGGMTFDQLKAAVKRAVNVRLKEEGMSLRDLGLGESEDVDEMAKSKKQQQFMGMVHAVQKGELNPDKVGANVEKAAETMTKKDAEDFASTKHKGLPEKVDEYNGSFEKLKNTVNQIQKDDEFADFKSLGYNNAIKEIVQNSNTIEDLTLKINAFIKNDKRIKTPQLSNAIYYNAINMFKNKRLKEEIQPTTDRNSMIEKIIEMDMKLNPLDPPTGMEGVLWKKLLNPLSDNTITMMYNNIIKDFNNKFSGIKEDTQTMIQSNGMSMSNKITPTGDQPSGLDMGMRTAGGMSETDTTLASANKLLEEINNELNAYSIHHTKLKKMAEDRKPSALVLRDRLGSENETNFKKDLQHSVTKDVIDIEKELQYKDQQTEVPKDPQKLGQDIEDTEIKATDAKSGEALKNVGDSANDKGDEIPKRNLTKDEQDEVDMYRLGQHSLVYDNEPGKRFEDRMKADMGDKVYDIRQKQMKFRGKAPMYNKDTQPTEIGAKDSAQFNKEESGWNEREGLKETMITGRFIDSLGKKFIMDFRLNEVKELTTPTDTARQTELFEIDFTGFGNKYKSKTQNKKVIINESVDNILSEGKYYTNGKEIFVIKNPVQKLNENEQKDKKQPVNEQFDKMKHLLGYKPNEFINTNNTKKNRGF
jgi:hypothetical protein